MALRIQPTSTVISSSSDSYRDRISVFETHIGGSSVWSIKNSTDNGSGNDYGLTLTPDDTNESFDTNIRYNSTDGNVYVAIDPNGQISDPLDPTGTGSSEVSPESRAALKNQVDLDTDMLIQEWNDAWGWLLKDSDGEHITRFIQIGRIVEPVFANDPGRGRDGLAWAGMQPDSFRGSIGYDNSNNTDSNEIHGPDGWTRMYSAERANDGFNDYSDITIPVPFSVYDDANSNNRRTIGMTKYFQRWNNDGGEKGMERIDTDVQGGFLFVVSDGSYGQNLVTPWDPAVKPRS